MSQPRKPARSGRRTVARHAALRSPHPFSQLIKVVAVAVAVVLVSGLGVAGYVAYDLESSLKARAVNLEGQSAAPPDLGAIEGGVNLFLAGVDTCEKEYAALFGARCGGRDASFTGGSNDVNMLVHISDNPRRVTVISFPRDLIISTPSCTRPDGGTTSATRASMLNSTYSYGGLSCIVKTVSQLSGQNIPFAAKVTWGGVIQVTNAIGGVTVCVANGIKDPDTGLNLAAGDVTISGLQALQFLRTRHGVGNGGDLGRISNQQQYMSRLAQKLVGEGVLSNPGLLYKLATTAVQSVTPSESLTNPLTLVQIALAMKSVPFDQIVFVQYPTLPDPTNPNRVVPNFPAADALWSALEANQQIQLTGQASEGDGVIVQTPAPTDTSGSTPTPTGTPSDVVDLPSSIAGQTAAEQTCSNGNVGRK